MKQYFDSFFNVEVWKCGSSTTKATDPLTFSFFRAIYVKNLHKWHFYCKNLAYINFFSYLCSIKTFLYLVHKKRLPSPRSYPEDTPKIDMKRATFKYFLFCLSMTALYALIYGVIQLVKYLANC